MAPDSLTFSPIGHVENGFPLGTPGETLKAAEARIVIDPELVSGLDLADHLAEAVDEMDFAAQQIDRVIVTFALAKQITA